MFSEYLLARLIILQAIPKNFLKKMLSTLLQIMFIEMKKEIKLINIYTLSKILETEKNYINTTLFYICYLRNRNLKRNKAILRIK